MRWTFQLYDVDGDRQISKNDLANVIDSIYLMMGKRFQHDQFRKESCQSQVENIFASIDTNKDNLISWEEFKEGIQYDPSILRILEGTH